MGALLRFVCCLCGLVLVSGNGCRGVAWICVVVVILVVGNDFLSGSLECWFVKVVWLV